MRIIRKYSLRKRLGAYSIRRRIRSKARVPRGWGFLLNPKKAHYNRVYHRCTFSLFDMILRILK